MDRKSLDRPAQRTALEHGGLEQAKGAPQASPTREKIERAALAVFTAKGIDAATTREIAAQANLSEGALYRHFPSKEAIAEALFITIHERLALVVRNAAQNHDCFAAQVEAVIDAFCETADSDWTLFSYYLLSTAHFLPTPPGRDDPINAARDIVVEAIRRGEITGDDPELIVAMSLGVVLQTALHKVYGRLQGSLTGRAPELKRAAISLLSTHAARK